MNIDNPLRIPTVIQPVPAGSNPSITNAPTTAASLQASTFQGRTVQTGTAADKNTYAHLFQNPPEDYICPVTHELMEEPYSNELGNTYEKAIIEKQLADGKPDPVSGKPFNQIFPNRGMKKIIEAWREQIIGVIRPGYPYLQAKNLERAQKYIRTGQEFEAQNDYEEAEESYKTALKFSDRVEDYAFYALCLNNPHNKTRNAERAYRALYILGRLYQGQDQLSEAKRIFQQAHTIFQDREDTLEELIEVCKKLNETDATVAYLNQQGQLYEKNHTYEKACKSYEAAFDLSKDKHILKKLADIYKIQGASTQAFDTKVRYFEAKLQETPERISLYEKYRVFLKANGRSDLAAKAKMNLYKMLESSSSRKNERFIELSNRIDRLNTGLNERDVKIESLKNDLIQKDERISDLRTQLDVMTNGLAERSNQIRRLGDRINTIDNSLAGRDVKIEMLKDNLTLNSRDIQCIPLMLKYKLSVIDISNGVLRTNHIDPINDEDLDQIFRMYPNITEIELSTGNILTDKSLVNLKNLTKLELLTIKDCPQLTDAWLVCLKDLINLRHLFLYNCVQLTDIGTIHLSGLINLKTLCVYNCHYLTNKFFEYIKDFKHLSRVDVHDSPFINADGLRYLKSYEKLNHLSMDYCHNILDTGVIYLKDLVNLNHLSLSYLDKITDKGLHHINNLRSLKSLYLRGCHSLTDEGRQTLRASMPAECVIHF